LQHVADIVPGGGSFTISNLEAGAIYSITTTTGQGMGATAHEIPAATAFPFPYSDNFDSYAEHATPIYFTDMSGTFEVVHEQGHACLKQVVPQEGLLWNPSIKPFTLIGDVDWTDYAVSSDVFVSAGNISMGGRWTGFVKNFAGNVYTLGYGLRLDKTGAWALTYQDAANDITLASGTINGFNGEQWHNMKISFNGTTITGTIDAVQLAQATDTNSSKGQAVIASTYDGNLFDNFQIGDSSITAPMPARLKVRAANTFALGVSYVNSSRPEIVITYIVPGNERAMVGLFSARGQKVRQLDVPASADGARGRYAFNMQGRILSAGIYLCRLELLDGRSLQRTVLIPK
jgi:hypothetical protein